MTPQKIMNAVCDAFKAPREVMDSRRRDVPYILPRQVAMYLCRDILKLSYPHIGRLFIKDHSTVLLAIRKIQDRLLVDEALRERVAVIREALGEKPEHDAPVCAGCLRREQTIEEIRQLLRVMQRAAGAANKEAA